jgi:hypothetical protein
MGQAWVCRDESDMSPAQGGNTVRSRFFKEMKNYQAQFIDMSRPTAVFSEDEGRNHPHLIVVSSYRGMFRNWRSSPYKPMTPAGSVRFPVFV